MGKSNMLHNINKQLRITVDDGRELLGKLLVYDKHMNVVLSDVEETRPQTKKMKEEGVTATRQLGLVLLRGEHVVSVTVLPDAHSKEEKEANFDKAPKQKKTAVKRTRKE
ncbi:small nuclear ribonucleoprotein B and B' [Strigomonas culicis]|uniref:Sm protein B n=1 Tax=Strigomonas culicis TaxID=28005 RepID=S9UPR2_9TRYP|nr:small nuclear ribonucleoprotein B and B' [Strigomonas culicis]|eukprot:EPY30774.1 small nuclear ribonucleoprotein B and B' [Strigomonas culicis]